MKKKRLSFLSIISISLILLFFNLSLAIAENPGGSYDPQCSSGGPGSVSCSITYSAGGGGGGVNGEGTVSCSVECTSGFYSCCFLSWQWPIANCICKSGSSTAGGGGATG